MTNRILGKGTRVEIELSEGNWQNLASLIYWEIAKSTELVDASGIMDLGVRVYYAKAFNNEVMIRALFDRTSPFMRSGTGNLTLKIGQQFKAKFYLDDAQNSTEYWQANCVVLARNISFSIEAAAQCEWRCSALFSHLPQSS